MCAKQDKNKARERCAQIKGSSQGSSGSISHAERRCLACVTPDTAKRPDKRVQTIFMRAYSENRGDSVKCKRKQKPYRDNFHMVAFL
jgi:hypothetical protein